MSKIFKTNAKELVDSKEMEDPGVLCDLKNYILEFQYPLVDSMSDEELADIFKQTNRGFLISWMLKLGIYDGEVSAEDTKFLGTILYENGFCTKEEMIPFMLSSLDPSKQLNILQNMFIYIKTIKKQNSDKFSKFVSLDDIETLSKNTLNLFPMYGEIKVLDNEKPSVIKTENVIEDYKYNISENNSINVDEIMENISYGLSTMKNVVKNRLKHEDNRIIPSPEADKIFKNCNQYMKQVCQFLKDIKTIQEFNQNNHTLLIDDGEISSMTSMSMLNEINEEIRKILRYKDKEEMK
ncbi:uncharacterized protein LOC130897764 [Diorhabda carinulata]|uniref:uncharacterized protein LOC130897764 n=1 Tax=Diorhabda carinulata TaxID=1163345 RepID=UPI0025A052DE|nr:uncharacterized protein LOC130897764 [Diorhabda carinulata]